MKKNITINLFGALYAIDEDAYELLNQYQNNMKSYFSRKEGGEEIADDIEHRIAELMAELKEQGINIITIELVETIIERIGNPEEIYDSETTETSGKETNTPKTGPKKLFRNPEDKMLGGVISGLACYIGIDTVWLRLITILLAWFSVGTFIIIYLILWIIVPESRSLEDHLRMQGRPVNMDNLREEIVNGARRTRDFVTSPETQSGVRGCLNGLFSMIAVLLKGFFVVTAGGCLFTCCILLFCLLIPILIHIIDPSSLAYVIENAYVSNPDLFMYKFLSGEIARPQFWCMLISSITLLVLTLYFLIHTIMRMLKRSRPLSGPMRITGIVVWLVALLVFIAAATNTGITANNYMHKQQTTLLNSFMQEQLERLNEQGWKVVRHENCDDWYVKSGEYYTGDEDREYIDANNINGGMKYEVEKTVELEPGTYRLEAAVRTNGEGCLLYAINEDFYHAKQTPANSNEGGNIWEEARSAVLADSTNQLKNSIAQAHDGRGFGWNRISTTPFNVKKKSLVRYGISNCRPESNWTGTWFSATDFKLIKED